MKNSRLFEILYILMEHRETTAGALAERLEVSVRTIYRDVDTLSAAGIPVYTEKGHGGGIRLMEQFQLDRTLLGEDEQEHIMTALQSLDAVGAGDSSRLLSQLAGLFGRQTVDWLEVDFETWGAGKQEKEYFELCKSAILHRRLLTFQYYNSSGIKSRRTVEPVRLTFKGGHWYVSGYCRKKQGFRLFRLNRIRELQMEREEFSMRKAAEVCEQKEEKPAEMTALKLRFTEAAGFQVLDFFTEEDIVRLEDGGFEVKAAFTPGRWLTGFILSFGADARVLEPEWLKAHIKKEAEKIRKIYDI